jgi:hypothetical protein
MCIYKMFSPDATGGGTTPATTTSKHKKSLIPSDIGNMWDVADKVCTKWGATPALICFWKTQADYAKNVDDLGKIIGKRNASGGNVTPFATTLDQLDAKVAKGIQKLKLYLEDKYDGKPAAIKQYSRYGIVKVGTNYVLPIDQQLRLKSFEMVIKGIADDGFGDKEYGTAFWTQLQADYKIALKQSTDNQQAISGIVGQKDILKAEVKKVLQALLHLLEGNYPDTYESVALEWGYKRG